MDGEEPSQEASADLDVRGVDLTMARVRTEIRGSSTPSAWPCDSLGRASTWRSTTASPASPSPSS